jgi:uncharacterized protein involved in type VI secretion and phage assembly
MMTLFFGKYRGKVKDNEDPMKMGRLLLSVPSVLGDLTSSWAMPCVPFAGDGVGFFALPPVNANVWVEFEGGQPDFPIWTGCFWDRGKIPLPSADSKVKVIKTDSATITFDDENGSLTIETKQGVKLNMDSKGMDLNNGSGGSIKLASSKVSINDGALEVI